MGHAIQILTFDSKTPKKEIEAKCDMWGDHNCDLEERGWEMGGGLPYPIRFTDKVFSDYDSAREYLESTAGNYSEIAVQYKDYPNSIYSTKATEDTQKRITEYTHRIAELDKPHYKGVKSQYIKCKKCGSSFATAYCGKTWYNKCPVCGEDMRPQTDLDKISKYKTAIKELNKKIRAEEDKIRQKNEKKAVLKWAVMCEVHC